MSAVSENYASSGQFVIPPAPYPGLRPFEIREWPIFFGRERMSEEIARRLVDDKFIVVHGDSGCGKSSLVMAGVLPRLEHGLDRAGIAWRTATMRPGDGPLDAIAEALARLEGFEGDKGYEERVLDFRRALNLGRDAAGKIVRMLKKGRRGCNCVLVDQFEELFAFERRGGAEEAQAFVEVLLGIEDLNNQVLCAILTMRSEFFGACARYTGFAEAVNRRQYLLPQMERAQLLRAIREPAPAYNGEVTRELAERLIEDAGRKQDQLPLIQHGLMLLHRMKVPPGTPSGIPWRLTLDDYTKLGGLAAMLSNHADQVMEDAVRDAKTGEADPERVQIVEQMFRSLTDITGENIGIRRPQLLKQLREVTGSSDETLRAIIDTFRADGTSFLTPYGKVPLSDSRKIDISHEALIRWWNKIDSKINGWLVSELRDGLLWRALVVLAEQYARDPTAVLPQSAVDERAKFLRTHNKAWSVRYSGDLGEKAWDLVEKLVNGSVQHYDNLRIESERQRQEEQDRKLRKLEEKRRQEEEGRVVAAKLAEEERLRLRQKEEEERLQAVTLDAAKQKGKIYKIAAVVSAGLLIVAVGAVAIAIFQWNEADKARARAITENTKFKVQESLRLADLANQQIEKGDATTGILLALRALPRDLKNPDRPIVPNAVTALYTGLMNLREQRQFRADVRTTDSAEFSSDGKRLVTSSADGTASVWDLASGTQILKIRDESSPGKLLAHFSPDGRLVVTASQVVKLWNVADRGEVVELTKADVGQSDLRVTSASFNSDGTRIVTVSGGVASTWDTVSGKLLRHLKTAEDNKTVMAAFSPSGAIVVTGSVDGKVRLWNSDTGVLLHTLGGHLGQVVSAVFSADGRRIVTASDDNIARIWDAASGTLIYRLIGHEQSLVSAAFSPDGKRVVTGARDYTTRLWDSETGQELSLFRGSQSPVVAAKFNKDSSRILTTSDDKTARLWDTKTGEELAVFGGHRDRLLDTGFSPDGNHITTVSKDGTIWSWAAKAKDEPLVLRGHRGKVFRSAFDLSGALAVTCSEDKTAKLWDAKSGKELRTLHGHIAPVYAAGFSPSGRLIVTASEDKTARVWAQESGRLVWKLEGHDGAVISAAFNHNDTRIVTGSADRIVRLWNVHTGKLLRSFAGHGGVINSVAFSQDGRRIVSAAGDNTARVWDVESGAELVTLDESQSSKPGSALFSANFSPDGLRIVTASTDGAVRIYSDDGKAVLQTLQGHKKGVEFAAFSNGGTMIVSASDDMTARVWNAVTGEELFALRGHKLDLLSAVFSRDDSRILTVSKDGTARIWSYWPQSDLVAKPRISLPRKALTKDQQREFYLTDESEPAEQAPKN